MRTRALISFAVLSNLVAFMSPSPGKCVFCGGGPLTKGHIWPEWMQQILPPKKHHLQFTGQIASIAPGAPVKQRLRQGHAGQRKPRNTCSACNTGWMSNIERDAIPYASPLILGQPVSLEMASLRQVCDLLGERVRSRLYDLRIDNIGLVMEFRVGEM